MSSGVMAYMARRILMLIPLLLGLSLIMFTLIQAAPGDPVLAMMGEQAASNPQYVEQARKNLGLDDPLPVIRVEPKGRVPVREHTKPTGHR